MSVIDNERNSIPLKFAKQWKPVVHYYTSAQGRQVQSTRSGTKLGDQHSVCKRPLASNMEGRQGGRTALVPRVISSLISSCDGRQPARQSGMSMIPSLGNIGINIQTKQNKKNFQRTSQTNIE